MLKFIILSLLIFITCSCNLSDSDPNVQPAQDVINADKISGSKIYHNPITADKPINDAEVPVIKFKETAHNFGKIKEGQTVEHIFEFKNVGKSPLVVSSAYGSCGCTVPSWPNEPVLPGKSAEIKVSYNSTGKKGIENKEIYIFANTIPNKTTLNLKAYVESNP